MFKRGDGLKLAALFSLLAADTFFGLGSSYWLSQESPLWLITMLIGVGVMLLAFVFAICGQKKAYSSFGMLLFVFTLIGLIIGIGGTVAFFFVTPPAL